MQGSYKEQITAIDNILRNEIELLDLLSPEQARIEAREGLIRVGVMDEDGKLFSKYMRECI